MTEPSSAPKTRNRRWLRYILAFLALGAAVVIAGVAIPLRQIARDQALIAAVKRNDYPAVVYQLDHGADPNVLDRSANGSGGYWEIALDRLLHRTNRASRTGMPVLYRAVLGTPAPGQPAWTAPEEAPIVRALLEHGADPNAHSSRGTTSLNAALAKERTATFHLLVEYGARLTGPQGNQGDSLLFGAIFEKNTAALTFLLDHGADVNFTDKLGLTPVMFAADDLACTRILLKRGADVRRRDTEGMSALDNALELLKEARTRQDNQAIRDELEIIRLLKQAAKPSRVPSHQQSPSPRQAE